MKTISIRPSVLLYITIAALIGGVAGIGSTTYRLLIIIVPEYKDLILMSSISISLAVCILILSILIIIRCNARLKRTRVELQVTADALITCLMSLDSSINKANTIIEEVSANSKQDTNAKV